MKQILIFVITALAMNAFGQIDGLNTKVSPHPEKFEKKGNDSIFQVSYVNPDDSVRKPIYYINGKLISHIILKTINPQFIDKINVVKRDTVIDAKNYYGEIHIQLKKDYKPKFISLADLKLRYTRQANASSIFMIDDEIISGDYRKYIVDENYILKIIVERIDVNEENLQVNVIRLLTKTEENIKKSKQIWIRGTSDLVPGK
ncbi:MAG TPA: hypothetical protein PLG33_04405 [Prolixibacteraceae bacterium]|nr:hypothetical protein [Prolixibacteraceae bacterium]HPR85269.1 hypothetical protein [Prolixibacteraceae bacterium]